MNIIDIINKKRLKQVLSDEEIKYVIDGYLDGTIKDYQMSSLLMAILLNDMTNEEIYALTKYMAETGDKLDLSLLGTNVVDKHSTGGVGDKTTLIIGPIVASCGVKVAKMSGRGLGHTGGTIDKLESIPGFKVDISEKDFVKQVNDIGISIISQTGNIAPADKKIYALRDTTATVSNIPLIASSIMSKKIAAGDKHILLDVKVGSGAFIKTKKDASVLASKMVDIGKKLGKNIEAILTNMDEPLGNYVGNSLEVIEAISVLKGKGNSDLRELSITLATNMVMLAKGLKESAARKLVIDTLDSGKALDKFKEFIKYQHGNPEIVDNYKLLPISKYGYEIKANKSGYITKMDTEEIGKVACLLGAGRATMEDTIDYGAGIIIESKVGNYVKKGNIIATLYTNKNNIDDIASKYLKAITISNYKPNKKKMILGKIK